MNPNEFRIDNVRINYTQSLWTPRSFDNDPNAKPSYQAVFILPPGFDYGPMMAACSAEAQAKFGMADVNALVAQGCRFPVMQHDPNKPQAGVDPGCAWFRGKSNFAPQVAYPNQQGGHELLDITRAQLLPGGCYVNVLIEVYGYDRPSRGFRFTPKGIVYVAPGEALQQSTDSIAALTGQPTQGLVPGASSAPAAAAPGVVPGAAIPPAGLPAPQQAALPAPLPGGAAPGVVPGAPAAPVQPAPGAAAGFPPAAAPQPQHPPQQQPPAGAYPAPGQAVPQQMPPQQPHYPQQPPQQPPAGGLMPPGQPQQNPNGLPFQQ